MEGRHKLAPSTVDFGWRQLYTTATGVETGPLGRNTQLTKRGSVHATAKRNTVPEIPCTPPPGSYASHHQQRCLKGLDNLKHSCLTLRQNNTYHVIAAGSAAATLVSGTAALSSGTTGVSAPAPASVPCATTASGCSAASHMGRGAGHPGTCKGHNTSRAPSSTRARIHKSSEHPPPRMRRGTEVTHGSPCTIHNTEYCD